MVTVQDIAMDNFTFLKLSRAVSGKGDFVLHTVMNVTKEIAFGQI